MLETGAGGTCHRSSPLVRSVSLINPALALARTQLAGALRSRVAGQDAQEKAVVIWQSEGPRWFTPEDPVWRVHADASMFSAGIRALLLQSLHPLAMAGVAAHSGYKGDPWGRLQRTSEFLATTTFGTIEHAERLIARIRAIHEGVRGVAPDGRPFAATDPHLLRWVHITEADSFLTAYQRYAQEPLSAEEADLYVAQTGVVATRLGVPDPPTTVAGLRADLDGYRPELAGTPYSVLLGQLGGVAVGRRLLLRGARAAAAGSTTGVCRADGRRGGDAPVVGPPAAAPAVPARHRAAGGPARRWPGDRGGAVGDGPCGGRPQRPGHLSHTGAAPGPGRTRLAMDRGRDAPASYGVGWRAS